MEDNNLVLYICVSVEWEATKSKVPELSGDRHAELKVSLEEIKLKVTEVDTVNDWHSDSSGELSIDCVHLSVDLGLDIAQDLVSSESKSSLKAISIESSSRVLANVSEDRSILRVDLSLGSEVVELSNESNLILNLDGHEKVTIKILSITGELGDTSSFWEHSRDGNSLSGSILGHELWDEATELIGGNGYIEVVLKEVSDIQSVSSLESTLKSGVESVVSEVSLELLALRISWGPGSWSVGRWLHILSIEESSVDNHGEDTIS